MAENASELYYEMARKVGVDTRTVTDPTSPAGYPVFEAKPGCSFELCRPIYNVPDFRKLNMAWAAANVLHFFAATDRADPLPKYNSEAHRFMTGNNLVGAYGTIAVPQMHRCMDLMRQHPHTRRAIVSMGPLLWQDANQPSCWSFLQFLLFRGELCLSVYQRSLMLDRVMPYDCILLTNVLNYAAQELRLPMGSLHWCIGSLHNSRPKHEPNDCGRHVSMMLPHRLLSSPSACFDALERPSEYDLPWIT